VADLDRGLAVLAVVGLGVSKVGRQKRRDGGTLAVWRKLPLMGQPLRDEAVVFVPARFGSVPAQVVVATIEGDNGATGRLVESVPRDVIFFLRQRCDLLGKR